MKKKLELKPDTNNKDSFDRLKEALKKRSLSNMSTTRSANSTAEPEWLTLVRDKVEGLSFGLVQIVVHDRKVTQIERTEKTRVESAPTEPLVRNQTR